MHARTYAILVSAAFAVGILGYSTVHKAIPYFAEIPADRFKTTPVGTTVGAIVTFAVYR